VTLLLWFFVSKVLNIDLCLVVFGVERFVWCELLLCCLFRGCELWRKELHNICMALQIWIRRLKLSFSFPWLIVWIVLFIGIQMKFMTIGITMWEECLVVVDYFDSWVMFFHYTISFIWKETNATIVFRGHIKGNDEAP